LGVAAVDSSPPRAGPQTKPSPIAEPIQPIAFARSLGSTRSATYACAVATLALDIPANTRATKTIASVLDKNKVRWAMTEPAIDTSITGRRPTRSESRPSSGAQMNCASEKAVDSRVTVATEAPKLSA